MARRTKTDRPVEKSISLPQSTVAQVDLLLFSQLEGRVPFGAWASLVNQLLSEWLARQSQGESNAQ